MLTTFTHERVIPRLNPRARCEGSYFASAAEVVGGNGHGPSGTTWCWRAGVEIIQEAIRAAISDESAKNLMGQINAETKGQTANRYRMQIQLIFGR